PPKLRNDDPRPTADTAMYAAPVAARNGSHRAAQAGRNGQVQPTRPRGPTNASASTTPTTRNRNVGCEAEPSNRAARAPRLARGRSVSYERSTHNRKTADRR